VHEGILNKYILIYLFVSPTYGFLRLFKNIQRKEQMSVAWN